MIKYLSVSILSCLLLFSLHSFKSEKITISGQVYDDVGNALIGASIIEKGTINGTTSDINGSFTLELNSKNSTIVISYTGYSTQEVKLKNYDFKKPLSVTLSASALLDEVVVAKRKESKISKIFSRPAAVNTEYEAIEKDDASQGVTYYDEETPPEQGNYEKIIENEFMDPLKDPLSTLSIDVDRASYSNVRRFLQSGVMPNKNAVRIEEMINYFNYDYKDPSDNKRPFATSINITECPWNPDHQLMHVALQGKKMDRNKIPPSNFVFLIDVSGSMNSANKLPLLKSAFKLLVNQLEEDDRVAIVVYAGAAGCVLESTPGSEKEKILESLNKLNAGGSTAGAAGIQQAYKIAKKNFIEDGNNRVILATDGDFNVGTSSDESLVDLIEEKRNDGIFLSILGFGTGNYQDGKMQKIADAGNGNHSYIDNMTEAKKVLMDEFGGTMFTIAKDVKIQIEFNPAVVESYRMVGYENRKLAARDFNDDTKDAGEMGAGHSVTVLYEIIPVGSKSDFSVKIDDLKYQNNSQVDATKKELATIKYRYKKPDENTSIKSEEIIENKYISFNKQSADIQWAACVAEFGMLLRDSKYLVESDYNELINRTKSSLSLKSDQYREEFLDLVEIAGAINLK